MGRNITPDGVRNLGKLLKRQLERSGMKQVDLLERLRAIGFETTSNAISQLANGSVTYIRADLLSAIASLKIFTDNGGNPLTTDELVLIACEAIAPPCGDEPDPAQTAYPEAVRFLLNAKNGRTIEDFAEFLKLKPRTVEDLLSGKRPMFGELLALGALFPDSNPMPLARVYGMAEDAPLPNGTKPKSLEESDQFLME